MERGEAMIETLQSIALMAISLAVIVLVIIDISNYRR